MPRPKLYISEKSKRSRMKILLAEALSRGIDLPQELVDSMAGIKSFQPFPKSPEGYYYKRDGRPYIPNDKQETFINNTARFSLLNSGRGGGKSAAGAQKALRRIEQGQSGIVLNGDFENLKISTWPEFREWIPWNQVIPKNRKVMGADDWFPMQPFRINFINGASVLLKGVNDPNSARGPNVNWMWFDEVGRSDIEGLAWKIAIAVVRIGKDPQAWATGTPNGKDHWVYKFFIEKDIQPEIIEEVSKLLGRDVTVDELIETVNTNVIDNKDNLDPMFYASLLMAYPDGWLKQQEIYGEFADRGSVLGNPRWFDGKILNYVPTEISRRIRFWDLAATEKKMMGKDKNDPDETVGTLMSVSEDGENFYIEDQVGGFWDWDKLKDIVLVTVMNDGPFVRQYIEEEPGSGGINQVTALAEHIKNNLPNWPTPVGWNPKTHGDKVMRANYWFSEAQQGRIWLVNGTWNKMFLDQLSSFPLGRHDDRVDSISGARLNIAPIRMWKNIGFLSL